MKRLFFALVMLAGVVGLSVPVLEACGAKFLVSSRAARYQQMQAAQSANIFLYWNETAENEAETRENNKYYEAFQEALENVGHRIDATTDEDVFREAARSGEFDIIMMPLAAAREFRREVESLAPGAVLLPVVEFATRAEKSRAQQEFGQVLATPATTQNMC